jgi:glycosyltransferase involved in cell wall biosynthesis
MDSLSTAKILHVIDHTESGGAQVVVENIIRGLKSRFSFGVAVLGTPGIYSKAYSRLGVPVYHLNRSISRWNPTSVVELIYKIRNEKFDLVHTHLFKSEILGTLAAKIVGRRVIIHDHSSLSPQSLGYHFPNKLIGHLYISMYRYALKFTDKVIVLTPETRQAYHKDYSLQEGKVYVAPNSVDIDKFSPKHGSKRNRSLCYDLQLSDNTRFVMMAGRLEPKKDWWTFLKVAERVRDLFKDELAFLMVGSGAEEELLLNYITDKGLDYVRFLGFRKDIAALLRQIDVFILTSCYESFGIAVLEAMAAGCAVVATRSGGPEIIITNGIDGLLSDVGDFQGLADHVVSLLENKKFRQMMGRRARQTVKNYYSIENYISRMGKIYDENYEQD